jgi:polyisoprenoid-binding protein YceI
MKTILIAWLMVFGGVKDTVAQDVFICRSVNVSLFSSAPIEDIAAKTDQGVSALNITSKRIYFKIPVRSFQFRKSLMQEHFNEDFLESDKYHYATFDGKVTSDVDLTQKGSHSVTVEGQLSIHGVTNNCRETGTLTVDDKGIGISSDFKVKLVDYKITIPKILFNNIAEVVTVSVHAKYLPHK